MTCTATGTKNCRQWAKREKYIPEQGLGDRCLLAECAPSVAVMLSVFVGIDQLFEERITTGQDRPGTLTLVPICQAVRFNGVSAYSAGDCTSTLPMHEVYRLQVT